MSKRSVLTPRTYYKPFEYNKPFELYEMSEKMHWLPAEVPMHQDVLDWKTNLTASEKNFLTQIFRLFTQSDLDVAGAYSTQYLPMFPKPEIRMMLLSFASREAVHIAAYSHLIDTLGMPESTYKQFLEYSAMKEKHDLFETFMKPGTSGIHQTTLQIAAFSAFTEGVQLFSSFVMLLNFTRFNKMNGMGQIINWSIKDESLHVEGMTWLFRELIKENRDVWTDELKSQIYAIAEKMVELEDKFIELAFNGTEMEGLTPDGVKQYIRYIADRRLIGLGMKGIFKVKTNPLPWVEEILNAPEHSNFFEGRASAYSKGSLTGSWNKVWL